MQKRNRFLEAVWNDLQKLAYTCFCYKKFKSETQCISFFISKLFNGSEFFLSWFNEEI